MISHELLGYTQGGAGTIFHLRRLWTTTFEKDESASFYGIRGLISLDDDNTPFETREEGGAAA